MSNINFYNNVLGIEGFIFNILHLLHIKTIHRDVDEPANANSWDKYLGYGDGDYGLILWYDHELSPYCYMHKKEKCGKLIWYSNEEERLDAIRRIGGIRATTPET